MRRKLDGRRMLMKVFGLLGNGWTLCEAQSVRGGIRRRQTGHGDGHREGEPTHTIKDSRHTMEMNGLRVLVENNISDIKGDLAQGMRLALRPTLLLRNVLTFAWRWMIKKVPTLTEMLKAHRWFTFNDPVWRERLWLWANGLLLLSVMWWRCLNLEWEWETGHCKYYCTLWDWRINTVKQYKDIIERNIKHCKKITDYKNKYILYASMRMC